MIYNFKCDKGHSAKVSASIHDGPPSDLTCSLCGEELHRNWQADIPHIDTSGCRDHDDIPVDKRVVSAYDRGSPEKTERQFSKHIQQRRREIADAGGQRGSLKQTHAVPTHLYHGKIKETGDPNYWNDPKNLNRHKSCKVD